MTIDAIQFDGSAIDKHLLTYDPDITETYLAATCLNQISFVIKERKHKRI